MTDLDKPLAHEWRFTAPTLATENTALRSLCAELVGALEPFARSLESLKHEPYPLQIGSDAVASAYDLTEADTARAFTALAHAKELLP